MPDSTVEIRCLDRNDEILKHERRLPHWAQNGTACFITFRTWDSIPAPVLKRFQVERRQWLRHHGLDPDSDWKSQLQSLPKQLRSEFHRTFSDRWHATLDACHGSCVLKRTEPAEEVRNSLLHFDGDRYVMTDFVVMPNHVHLLAAFSDADAMLAQCESWKHYTAQQINRWLGRSGRFWQQDGFDHLVRSAEQFEYLRRYIADNPRRARLRAGQFVHYTRVDLGIVPK